jgi:hypothetical protein
MFLLYNLLFIIAFSLPFGSLKSQNPLNAEVAKVLRRVRKVACMTSSGLNFNIVSWRTLRNPQRPLL